jgi:hypothetical protein
MQPILPSLFNTNSSTSQQFQETDILAPLQYDDDDDDDEDTTEVNLVHETADIKRAAYNVKVKGTGAEKLHFCPYDCRKSFKKPIDLVRHIRTHTGERPFSVSQIFVSEHYFFMFLFLCNLIGPCYFFKIVSDLQRVFFCKVYIKNTYEETF